MKKLLIAIAIVLLASPCFAWTLSWDAATGADGYKVYYKPIPDTAYLEVDTGTTTSADLDALGLAEGVRYEIYVQAYANTTGGGVAYSGDSDHLRWTYPSTPIVVDMLGQPVNIVINP